MTAAHDSSSPPVAATVAERLRGARRRGFVGRAAELELFRTALEAPEPPFSVLWACGPGGVGKTTLLDALAEEARLTGRRPALIDMRAVEPSPPAFTAELARAMGHDAGASALALLAGQERPVLMLDTFETAVGLEDWLREQFLPALPAGALMVIAGRARPGGAWREDPGWRELLRVVSLRNLDPDDARELLRRAGVAEALHDWVLELTHGHPLALSLLVDVLAQHRETDLPLELDAVPDVVGRLVTSFLAGVPSPRHRFALELAAHAHFTTAGVLRGALGDEDGEALFAWMRSLSFIECGPHGLFPHELAREVIDADLRWRDTAAYERVHGLVRTDVCERLIRTEGRENQRALADLMYLHRGNPAARAFWDWKSLGEVYADAARQGDRDAILAMVERHEGRESRALAARWLERRPEAFAAFHGRAGEPVGFMAQLALETASEEELADDPGARAMWAHALAHTPPRADDEVLACRFAMDRDAYQAPSRSFNVVTMLSTQEWLKRPRLSWYYIPWADPDAFAPLMAYIGFQRARDADFEVGGRRYGVFARDWRREGGAEWLDRMSERELGGAMPAPDEQRDAPEPLALSQPEFAVAVRHALRALHQHDELSRNPLVRARVVRDRGGPGDEALRDLIEEAVDSLRADPRAAKLVRSLDRTYLRPAPTQEAAADVLGLPFSTYRGHLTRGVERVVDWLWQRELYGAPGRNS